MWRAAAGRCDNNAGEYEKESVVRILMVSAEFSPWAKVGGLADVTTSLSATVAARGHDVRVVLPLYGHLDRVAESIRPIKKYAPVSVRVGQHVYTGRIHLKGSSGAPVKIYMTESNELFGRDGIYSGADEVPFVDALARASFHTQLALNLPAMLDWPVDIVHCHDAQASLAAVYRQRWYGGRSLPGPGRTLLTIHNLAHQEVYPAEDIDFLGLPRELTEFPEDFEFHGQMNLLKAGILAADLVNTVSPTYSREVVSDPELGCGLGGVLKQRRADFSGILNGADYDVWDPRRDPLLPVRFGYEQPAGKQECRAALCRQLGLDPARGPLLGMVGRLVEQKGFDLVLKILDELLAAGCSLVVLGRGDKQYAKQLRAACRKHPTQLAFSDEFDEPLAHLIYAGSDSFLMPSRFEPCGLSQLYALRYGSLPVVRRTGGLADTVKDAMEPDGVGFVFRKYDASSLLATLLRAQKLWRNPDHWRAVVERAMQVEFGWDRAADAYEQRYRDLLADGVQASGVAV